MCVQPDSEDRRREVNRRIAIESRYAMKKKRKKTENNGREHERERKKESWDKNMRLAKISRCGTSYPPRRKRRNSVFAVRRARIDFSGATYGRASRENIAVQKGERHRSGGGDCRRHRRYRDHRDRTDQDYKDPR